MKIIGITGTIGAGKGTVVEYLVKEKGFLHFSVREYLVDILKQQNKPVNRATMVELANDLRSRYSPSYIVDQLFLRAQQAGGDVVIESIRTPGEVDSLRTKGAFILFAVDADAKKRYERISVRNSETDNVSWEQFCEGEEAEMTSTDPNKQNLRRCIEMSDFLIYNNDTISDLYKEVEVRMSKIE